jgi:hypothetical protein
MSRRRRFRRGSVPPWIGPWVWLLAWVIEEIIRNSPGGQPRL